MNDFFENINSQIELKKKLIERANEHQSFSFYTNYKIAKKTKENGIMLTNGRNWNDKEDAKNLNYGDKIRFVKCFTYSKSENIAMWMLYAYKNNEGCLVKYSKSQIVNIVKDTSTIIIKQVGNDNDPGIELTKDDFEIELIDVVYFGDGEEEGSLALKKSIYGIKSIEPSKVGLDFKNQYFVKTYGWAYENECRLVVSIKKELLKDNEEKEYCVFIPISKLNTQKNTYPIVISSPNNEKGADNCVESEYKGRINFDLYAVIKKEIDEERKF